jgi:hypothetical protein
MRSHKLYSCHNMGLLWVLWCSSVFVRCLVTGGKFDVLVDVFMQFNRQTAKPRSSVLCEPPGTR